MVQRVMVNHPLPMVEFTEISEKSTHTSFKIDTISDREVMIRVLVRKFFF